MAATRLVLCKRLPADSLEQTRSTSGQWVPNPRREGHKHSRPPGPVLDYLASSVTASLDSTPRLPSSGDKA